MSRADIRAIRSEMATDRALILGAIQQMSAHVDARFDRIDARLDTIVEQVAGLTVELATHRHEEEG